MSALTNWASAVLVCMLLSPRCAAQGDSWELIKVIAPGRSVQVKLHSAKAIKGKMGAWRADGISITQSKKVISMDKDDVAEIALLIGRSRGRKAMLAGVITGGAVAGIVGASYGINADDCCFDPSAGVLVPLAAGFWGGVAAGIAALFPQHQEVIYSAARAETQKKR